MLKVNPARGIVGTIFIYNYFHKKSPSQICLCLDCVIKSAFVSLNCTCFMKLHLVEMIYFIFYIYFIYFRDFFGDLQEINPQRYTTLASQIIVHSGQPLTLKPLKRQPHKMVKHLQTIRQQNPTNCLSVYEHFVGLALKGLISASTIK